MRKESMVWLGLALVLGGCQASRADTAEANAASVIRGKSPGDPGAGPTLGIKDIPGAVRAFIQRDDVPLAYKAMNLTGGGTIDHVLVLRRATAVTAGAGSACDLLVLHDDDGELSLAGKNSRIVDCEYNDANIEAAERELNPNLQLSPERIEFTNENRRGGYYGYTFGYVEGKWILLRAVSSYKEDDSGTGEIDVYKETASYPEDFGVIPLSGFEPRAIAQALRKNKSLVK